MAKRIKIGDEIPGFGKVVDIVALKKEKRGRPPKKRRARRKGRVLPIKKLVIVEYHLPDDVVENFDEYNPFYTKKGGSL